MELQRCENHVFFLPVNILTRDATIYRYIDILQYFLSQYNTICVMKHIDILRIAIYCCVTIYCIILQGCNGLWLVDN